MLNLNELSRKYFDLYQNNTEAIDCRIHKTKQGMIVDAGVEAAGGWQAGSFLLQTLICGLGDVVYDKIDFEGIVLPTVCMYLDNPALVAENYLRHDLYLCTEELPEEGNFVTAGASSIVHHIFEAGSPALTLTKNLMDAGVEAENILWGFSSTVLLFKGKDPEGAAIDREMMLEKGCAVSIWLNAKDDFCKEFLKDHTHGEIRLHNLRTGNTFVSGRMHLDAITEYVCTKK